MLIMSSLEIIRYLKDVPTTVADQVSRIFEDNYPVSRSEKERLAEIQKHSGAQAIRNLLIEGRSLYVASQDHKNVAGFLESTIIDQTDGTYELLSWIMTATEFRGIGIASSLHNNFITDARIRAKQRLPKPTLALLNVNLENPAKNIYQKWGYRVQKTTQDGKHLMIKTLLSEK
jgi:ribosomal protein S18 acetylase RimI-like enzyme